MTFANRAILVGLLALAIPLAIHLLGRRRARKVVLPTARFAEGAHQASRGRLWLKRVALLVVRLAVVALLVLALAGPRIGGSAGGRWLLVLDASPSMRMADAAGRSAFERSRTRLARVLGALDEEAEVTLALTDGRGAGGCPEEVRRALEEMTDPGWRSDLLGRTIREALAAPKTASEASAAHLILATDATPAAVADLRPGAFAKADVDVTILATSPAEANVWVGLPRVTVEMENGQPVVCVEAEARATDPRTDVTPTLWLHATIGRGRSFRGNGRVRFRVPPQDEGPWQGNIRIRASRMGGWTTSASGSHSVPFTGQVDVLSIDNVRYFTVAAPRAARVLVVDAAEEPDARVRSADLVAAAFAGEAGVPKPVTRVEAAQVDLSALGRADVAFWVGSQHPRQIEALREFVGRGGGLVWLPADYRPMKDATFSDWLGIRGDPGVEQSPDGVTIDPAGYTSDLLAAFEGGTSGDLNTPVFRRQLCLPRTENTVIRFRDGLPAVQAQRHGKGCLVVLAFGPSPYWGDLAGRPEWVVLVHSLAEALAHADGPQVANLIVGNVAQSRPAGYEDVPGNYISPASEGRRIHYSVNIEPNETADLAPRVDHLAAAFAEDRVRVVSGDFSPERAIPALSGGAGTDLSPLVIAALALALTAESLLSVSQSGRLWRRPRGG